MGVLRGSETRKLEAPQRRMTHPSTDTPHSGSARDSTVARSGVCHLKPGEASRAVPGAAPRHLELRAVHPSGAGRAKVK